MGTTADKLNKLIETKAAIKAAIEAKGVTDVGDKFSDYPAKIESIQSGSIHDFKDWSDDSVVQFLLDLYNDEKTNKDEYPYKTIYAFQATSDTINVQNNSKFQYLVTSDNQEFSITADTTLSITYDKSFDIECKNSKDEYLYSIRYVILYYKESYFNEQFDFLIIIIII